MSFLPIADHGVVGDLRTVALVGTDATVDFMCAPRFDSATVFASLLEPERGGSFRIEPSLEGARRRQMYLPDTNVLLTRFLSPAGVAEVSDFMPIAGDGHPSRLLRRIKAVRGGFDVRVTCAPRFGYGSIGHQAAESEGQVSFVPDQDALSGRLSATVPLRVEKGDAIATFHLDTGQSAVFMLELGALNHHGIADLRRYAASAFKDTTNFWRDWVGRSSYRGRWRDEVHRSALCLKLLFSQREGSLVAAPTFGLPEALGGVRNWDYRYTWVRDAAFTLYALNRLGLTEESGAFMGWIADRCHSGAPGPGGPLQPLYALDGSPLAGERELDWRGYRDSRPVRVGNAASSQIQLDIYGALMDSVYLYDKYGEPIPHDFWMRLVGLVEWVCESWRRPDHGIWEIRSHTREHLNSRLLCWVAIDRAVRLAIRRSLPAPLTRWIEERDRIYQSIYQDMWSEERQAFVSYAGSTEMDASVLLMPLLRFIAPTDPRWRSTLRAVEEDLVEDSLVRRYRILDRDTDGLPHEEGTFTICSFWYAECLSRGGNLQQARLVFEKVLGYANHVGLFAEQIGASGEHLGNFPQAFTHLALISAAYDIDRRLQGAGWRA